MFKKMATVLSVVVLAATASITAQAGVWKQDNVGWWWRNDDGSYPVSKWEWLDGNNDGVAESYCFDARSYMYADTVTPDNYTVNKDGQWTVNGVVQTKNVGSTGSGNGTTGTTQQTVQPASGSTNPADYGVSAERAQAGADILPKIKNHYTNFYDGPRNLRQTLALNGFSQNEIDYAVATIDWNADAAEYARRRANPVKGNYDLSDADGDKYFGFSGNNFRKEALKAGYSREQIETGIAISGVDWGDRAAGAMQLFKNDGYGKYPVTTLAELHHLIVDICGFTESEYQAGLAYRLEWDEMSYWN